MLEILLLIRVSAQDSQCTIINIQSICQFQTLGLQRSFESNNDPCLHWHTFYNDTAYCSTASF